MAQGYRYDALSRETFDVLAYNAIGRASEVNLYSAYQLQKSTGNSGWSVGFVQWDFGQPGRGWAAEEMLRRYAQWASPAQRFAPAAEAALLERLQTRGATGNALEAGEKARLDGFLRSDAGRMFVDELNARQIDAKWERVGSRLAAIPALQEMNRDRPGDAARVVTMVTKLFNQNEVRGARLVDHLERADEVDPTAVRQWIESEGVRGLRPSARDAILSGRDAADRGALLVSALETGEGALARQWRASVRDAANPSLSRGFNESPALQLFDAMLRSPVEGQRVLAMIDGGQRVRPLRIVPLAQSREEVSRVSVLEAGSLAVERSDGTSFLWESGQWRPPARPDPRFDLRPARFGPTSLFSGGPGAVERTGHPLHEQAREGVLRLEQSLGRSWDACSERLAASLARAAAECGLTRIDHVALSRQTQHAAAGQYAFAVQGALDDPAALRVHVSTDQAICTPVEESLRGLSADREPRGHATVQQEAPSQRTPPQRV